MFYWIALALFFLAVMETVSHHFKISIFFKIKNKFWYDFFESDWRRKYRLVQVCDDNGHTTIKRVKKKGLEYFIALIDAYHVSKWGMILSFALAFDVALYVPIFAVLEWGIHRVFYTNLFINRV